MPEHKSNFVQEVADAFRGVLGLVVGDREAPRRFNLSTEGLIGSLIALLLITGLSDYLPVLLGRPGAMFRSFASDTVLTALQWGCSALVLRQVGRSDGFVPYLIADNWATVFITIAITTFQLVGGGGDVLSLGVIVLLLVVAVNIGRLVVGLPALQVATLVIAQLTGAAIGILAIGMLFPIPPEALAQ